MIRTALACAGMVALLSGCVQPPSQPATTVPTAPAASGCGQAPAAEAAAVLAAVNRERGARGLAPLRAEPRLAAAAQGHACDNARRGSISHSGSDGSDLGTRIRRAGYRPGYAAENTGRGFDGAASMVAYWMNSAGHRANILNPNYREAGVGLVHPTGDRRHWVLVLAAPR